LSIGGVLLLTYLGVMCWLGALKSPETLNETESASTLVATSPASGYITGLLMTLLNPMTLGFWFVAVPDVVRKLSQRPTHDLPIICVGVFLGTIGWVIGFAGTLKLSRRWRRPWWIAAADAFGGTMLLAFAGFSIWRTFTATSHS
jgi:threonine/homoserine/homoserine lactone efflux protein